MKPPTHHVLGMLLAGVFVLAACAPMPPAPVEQRETRSSRVPLVAPAFYQVQRGDTLYSIAFRYRLDWREVARWNRIAAPYVIRPDQELRLFPPVGTLAGREPTPEPTPEPERESDQPPVLTPTPTPPSTAGSETPSEAAPQPSPAATADPPVESSIPAANSRRVAGIDWRWPTAGVVSRPYDPAATRRGIGIAGQSGQPVVAAANGQVVYSGTALIGYGELIIIKHSDTLLSAYAHNRVRLVQEGVRVRAGQPIAEMGISDRNQQLLHFEVRRNGQPENPLNFLPRR